MTSFYSHWIRPFLFRMDPERAHDLATRFLPVCLPAPVSGDPALTVDLGPTGLRFRHPVGLAAGFDKNARWIRPLARLGFAAVEIGTVTPKPQPGNPRPRLFRFPDERALVNRLGFNNDGADAIARRLAGRSFPVPVGVNLGKQRETPPESAPDDYARLSTLFADHADYFVVNVSSPNTPGLRDLQSAAGLRAILSAVNDAMRDAPRDPAGGEPGAPARTPPVFCKFSPDMAPGALEESAGVAVECGASGLILTNTTVDRAVLGSRDPGSGGLSGAPLAARALETLRRARRVTGGVVPLIAAGGVFTGEDAFARIRAGASFVQIYTAFVYEGPGVVRAITRELATLVRREGFATISEAVGTGNG